jgi:hypothetical protein
MQRTQFALTSKVYLKHARTYAPGYERSLWLQIGRINVGPKVRAEKKDAVAVLSPLFGQVLRTLLAPLPAGARHKHNVVGPIWRLYFERG